MRNRRIAGLTGAVLFVLTACSDSGPTAPTESANPLVGEWHGTLFYTGGECGGEEVDVTARLEGGRAQMDVQSSCYGPLVLRLTNFGQVTRGNATIQLATCITRFGRVENPVLTANVSGTLGQERLRLDISTFISNSGSVLVRCNRSGATLELVR